MPHYLVELYTPNAAWRGLSPEHRQQFISGIQAAMGGLAGSGIELLTLAETDTAVDHSTSHRFLGIWRFPDAQARNALLAGIAASGWYDYFDHINAAAATGGMEEHLRSLS
ncbi:DUF6616 family protein [Klebsiella pasteurii]|uniref:DUF6616 family protein n=1 Tax=Klebsiella pasteurii TaxID=2587529 RepID=UPI00237B7444|nr:DUF6616 family protein [Klebsiella pasteurii]MDD9650547.1 hypothetical protein [Klebsiella pasteurii]